MLLCSAPVEEPVGVPATNPSPFVPEAGPQGQPGVERSEGPRRVKSFRCGPEGQLCPVQEQGECSLLLQARLNSSPASWHTPQRPRGGDPPAPASRGKGPPALMNGAQLWGEGQRAVAVGRSSRRSGV